MALYKFIKLRDKKNQFDNTQVKFMVQDVNLNNMLEAFEDFLKASGFHFEGRLEIIKEDEYVDSV